MGSKSFYKIKDDRCFYINSTWEILDKKVDTCPSDPDDNQQAGGGSSAGLERLPVTQEVASSSLVHPASFP